MSVRLVRRLLQQTSELDATSRQKDDEQEPETAHRPKRKKAKQASVPVGENEVVRHQVDSLLRLDRKMAANNTKKNITLSRLRDKHGEQKRIQKTTAKKVLGNSRSVSSDLKTKRVPTFDKKRYKKQQEEQRLAKIAKLLKKNYPKSK